MLDPSMSAHSRPSRLGRTGPPSLRASRPRPDADAPGVVAILAEHDAPLGAYAVIEALAKRENKAIAPPTVYRALDFLIEHGFLHRIESRNVFAPCAHFDHAHRGVLLSCEVCGRSVEIEDEGVGAAIDRAAQSQGFAPKGLMIEVTGRCADCVIAS